MLEVMKSRILGLLRTYCCFIVSMGYLIQTHESAESVFRGYLAISCS